MNTCLVYSVSDFCPKSVVERNEREGKKGGKKRRKIDPRGLAYPPSFFSFLLCVCVPLSPSPPFHFRFEKWREGGRSERERGREGQAYKASRSHVGSLSMQREDKEDIIFLCVRPTLLPSGRSFPSVRAFELPGRRQEARPEEVRVGGREGGREGEAHKVNGSHLSLLFERRRG